jgi:hypothetical protein
MPPAPPETTAEAARQLDYFCPPLETRKEASNYFWATWEILIDIARSPEVTPEAHERLVGIVECLGQCAKGEMVVWGVRTHHCISQIFTTS